MITERAGVIPIYDIMRVADNEKNKPCHTGGPHANQSPCSDESERFSGHIDSGQSVGLPNARGVGHRLNP
jgi:hypothetical protein